MQKRPINQSYITLLQQKKWLTWSLILLITVIWGYSWVLMKESLFYMGPFTFSAFRFGTGALTLFVILIMMRAPLPPKDQWKHLIMIGILQTSIVFLLTMYGLRFVDAGKSSVLLYSMPIFSSMFAARFLQEKLTKQKAVGLGIGLFGLITILGWDVLIVQDPLVIFGEGLIIIGAISWGVSNVYYRKNIKGLSQLQVTAYQMMFGTIGIILAALAMEAGDPVILNGHSMYIVLFTGVLASALCFTGWFILLSAVDMVTATISTLLVPVFGVLFSTILLGETLTIGIIIGSLFILAGIVIAQISVKKGDRE
ncbi:DMT family transporter [Oceanobacillus halotolerans]|uniref:DMT family transporter n=1 Tax=Oceanobacillus halotolerans TaxID=2663380 RepID=UPI0013DD5970|nr:DMT family transporter [Oceanobacillus halotolerans]